MLLLVLVDPYFPADEKRRIVKAKSVGVVGAILIVFLHSFVSTGYPISHKIVQQCPFMQTAQTLQNHGKRFFPASTQSSEISSFGNIFAISRIAPPLGQFGYAYFFKRKPVYQQVP